MKTTHLLASIALATVTIFTGCSSEKTSPLVGEWHSDQTSLTLNKDGTFMMQQGAQLREGSYQNIEAQKRIVLIYTDGKAERRMMSEYSLTPGGNRLAINRTFFGTLILERSHGV